MWPKGLGLPFQVNAVVVPPESFDPGRSAGICPSSVHDTAVTGRTIVSDELGIVQKPKRGKALG